ncbi:MAG: SMC family ATPase [Selenomonadaceae bacterium]
MRPLKLIFSAFGPYEKETTLDFAELCGRSFFLIHGATGAGKTTILDAICFSLYGDASGEKREAKMLRSDRAKPEEATQVEFAFSLGEDIYRVWRSPEQLRAKKRGMGTTLSPAEAILYRVLADGTEKLLAQGYANVTLRIESLLGFKSSQFRQVVLLPQGEFRRLLMANSAERQEIMEVLFKTEFYRHIEEKLRDEAKDITAAQKEFAQQRQFILEEAQSTSLTELLDKVAECKKNAAVLEKKVVAKHDLQQKAQKADAEGQLVESRFKAASAATEEKVVAEAKILAVEQYRQSFSKAEKAAQLEDCEKQMMDTAGIVKHKKNELAKLRMDVAQLAERLLRAQADFAVENAHETQRKESDALVLQLQKFTKQAEELEIAVTALKEKEKQAALRRQQQQETVQKAQHIQIEAEKKLQEAEADYNGKQTSMQRLQHLFAEGQAALLANRLVENSPCPVCGSRQHPQPAVMLDVVPDEAEIKAAQQAAAASDAIRNRQRQAMQTMEKQQQAIQQQAEQLAVMAEGECKAARIVLAEKERALPEAYRKSESLRIAQQKAKIEQETLYTSWKKADELRQQLQKEAAAAASKRDAVAENLQELEKRSNAAKMDFLQRCKAGGFATAEEYQKAKWAEEYREKVKLHIREFDDRLTAIRAAAVKTAKDIEKLVRPDLEVLADKLKRTSDEYNIAYADEKKMMDEIKRMQDKVEKLQLLEKKSAAVEQKYRTIGTLADVAGGRNVHGMTFQRFVLKSLLADVIEAANMRLKIMSRGQYLLQPGERARKNAAGGLDMEIFDAYTGYARPMATLSGGESFLASLSLALGLADVVQSYAGGIHLDTIFVDEGFGTLDAETLDMALKALIELQKGGRIVGIISHVEELKERIDARLEVTKTREGSTAKFIVG